MDESIYKELEDVIFQLKKVARKNKMEYFEVLQTFNILIEQKKVEKSEDFNELFPKTLNNILIENKYDMMVRYAIEHFTGELAAMLADYKEE